MNYHVLFHRHFIANRFVLVEILLSKVGCAFYRRLNCYCSLIAIYEVQLIFENRRKRELKSAKEV